MIFYKQISASPILLSIDTHRGCGVMAESGIEIDIGSLMDSDEFPEFDGQIGELKSSSFVDKSCM